MRHAAISIEKTWATKYCPDHCFDCYLVVSEVNANYDQAYFQYSSNALPELEFRRRLSKEILENTIGRYGNGGGQVWF